MEDGGVGVGGGADEGFWKWLAEMSSMTSSRVETREVWPASSKISL